MPKTIYSKVAGVTAKNDDGTTRQGMIKRHLSNGEQLLLEREPRNKFDPNAIAILGIRDITTKKFDSDPEFKIGYINRELAAELAPWMDNGQIIKCFIAEITGGKKGESYGVNIRLEVFSEEETAQIKQERAERRALPAAPQASLVPVQKAPEISKQTWKNIGLGLAVLILISWSCDFFRAASQSTSGEVFPVAKGVLLGLLCLTVAGYLGSQIVWKKKKEEEL